MAGKPDQLERVLLSEYGIQVQSIRQVQAGWSASAWKVHSISGDFFLKVYDKDKPSTKSWIARIDKYMPVTLWLYENTLLRENMVAPLLTKTGCYKREEDACLYMVFPYIHGQTMGNARLDSVQIRDIAQTVALLHTFGGEVPVPTDPIRETFDVSFCDQLNDWLNRSQDPAFLKTVSPYADILARSITSLKDTASLLGKSEMRHVLCHTDIHGWNLMQSNRMILIDWEGLKLAPVEADLFSFTDTFFFGYAWEEFLSAYGSVHKDFKINPDAMRFYRWRRRLEDIHAFASSMLFDSLTPGEMDRCMFYLHQECALLSKGNSISRIE